MHTCPVVKDYLSKSTFEASLSLVVVSGYEACVVFTHTRRTCKLLIITVCVSGVDPNTYIHILELSKMYLHMVHSIKKKVKQLNDIC